MELLQWHKSFNVGVKLVDRQHKKLFSLINELIVQTQADQQKQIIEKVLDELVAYTDYHFTAEEKLFRMHPGYKKHKHIHEGFIDKVTGFISAFKTGNTKFKPAIVGFLVNWVKNHVLDTDKAYFKEMGYSLTEGKDHETLSFTSTKILVVEDSMDQRVLLKAILEQEGHNVFEAVNGVEAIKICQDNTDIRMVITDINIH